MSLIISSSVYAIPQRGEVLNSLTCVADVPLRNCLLTHCCWLMHIMLVTRMRSLASLWVRKSRPLLPRRKRRASRQLMMLLRWDPLIAAQQWWSVVHIYTGAGQILNLMHFCAAHFSNVLTLMCPQWATSGQVTLSGLEVSSRLTIWHERR